jgi:hypothetical protein
LAETLNLGGNFSKARIFPVGSKSLFKTYYFEQNRQIFFGKLFWAKLFKDLNKGSRLRLSETSRVDYVRFEAAGLLKEGLIREWHQVVD